MNMQQLKNMTNLLEDDDYDAQAETQHFVETSYYDFAIALSLNNWQLETITRHDIPGFGPRWSVKVRFHNIHSTDEAIAKLRELKADCATQQLAVDHATVRSYRVGEPVIASLVILEPCSKSAIVS